MITRWLGWHITQRLKIRANLGDTDDDLAIQQHCIFLLLILWLALFTCLTEIKINLFLAGPCNQISSQSIYDVYRYQLWIRF